MKTRAYESRSWGCQGFEVLDAKDHMAIDGICRFMFRGYQISLSSWNYSRGGCLNEVAIFESVPGEDTPFSQWLTDADGERLGFKSAEAAIEYLIKNDLRADV
jgi:hypothetical protein